MQIINIILRSYIKSYSNTIKDENLDIVIGSRDFSKIDHFSNSKKFTKIWILGG